LSLSGQMNKTPGDEVMVGSKEIDSLDRSDPFIILGSEVVRRFGAYLITAVGEHAWSINGYVAGQSRSDNTIVRSFTSSLPCYLDII